MKIESEKDFNELRKNIDSYHKKFPMFRHDIAHVENIIEEHIKQHSIAMVYYRQSHKKNFLDRANKEIEEINRVVNLIEKIELMAILSQG
jgi:hypothetical protein